MKKLALISLLFIAFGCKKKNQTIEDITTYNWVLTSATINPAKVFDGKAQTNYMLYSPSSPCLNHNYTLIFHTNGIYGVGSNGPLCDMLASTDKFKYTKKGDEIILSNEFVSDQVLKLNGNKITTEQTTEENGKRYTITYTYTAKKK